MIDRLVDKRLAQFARIGFRTSRADGAAATAARRPHATARCQRTPGRTPARARPTRIPAWPRLPPASAEMRACGWSRYTLRNCGPNDRPRGYHRVASGAVRLLTLGRKIYVLWRSKLNEAARIDRHRHPREGRGPEASAVIFAADSRFRGCQKNR